MPVARNITETMLASFSDIPASNILSCKVYRATIRTPKTGNCLDQLILAVPSYPGDSQDLAGPNVETDVPDNLLTLVGSYRQILHFEHRLSRVRHTTIYRELDFTTNHQRGQIILVRLRG